MEAKKEDSTYIQPDSMEIGPAGEKMGQESKPDQAMVSTPSKVKNVPMTWERVFTWGDALNIDRYEQPRGRGAYRRGQGGRGGRSNNGYGRDTRQYTKSDRYELGRDGGVLADDKKCYRYGVVSAWSASSTLSFWAGH